MRDFITFPESIQHGLSNSYIIGVDDVSFGVEEVKKFAQTLNCLDGKACGQCSQCSKIERQEHSDFIIIPSEEAGEIKTIKIDEVRRMQTEALMKPFEGKYKVFLLKYADRMTDQAQNSMLKILEESPSRTVIVLLTTNVFGLLSTIRSRCRLISYPYRKKQGLDFSSQVDVLLGLRSQSVDVFFDFAKEVSKTKEDLLAFLDMGIVLIRDALASLSGFSTISNCSTDKINQFSYPDSIERMKKLSYYRGLVAERSINKELVAIDSLALLAMS